MSSDLTAQTQTSFDDFQKRQVLCVENRVRRLPRSVGLRRWCINTDVHAVAH